MIKTFYLGTAVQITSIVQQDDIDDVKVTIISPLDEKLVEDGEMTKSSDTVFKYTYQTDEDGTEGEYIVICEAERGDNVGVSRHKFKLVDPED